MGHRIEPYVSIPTKLQTDSTGFTLESVIHIGCTPLLLLLWNPLVFRLFFAFGPYFKWILPSFERKGEEKEELGAGKLSLQGCGDEGTWHFSILCAV